MSSIHRATLNLPKDVGYAKGDWSPDREYRYRLTWATSEEAAQVPLPVFVGLNGSGASETAGDKTLLWNWQKTRGFHMLNLLGFRATFPWDLLLAEDPNGPENDQKLREYIEAAPYVIVCWGGPPKVDKAVQPDREKRREQNRALQELHAERVEHVHQILRASQKQVLCLGLTNSGYPRHPSRLGYAVSLVPYELHLKR